MSEVAGQQPPQPMTPDAGIDPVTGLHRMSKTAGVGLQDYAEVSPFAVWSMVLGLSSWLVFFGPVLYVVPALGFVFGVFAVTRILRSNGTQTGLLPALLGIGLSAGLSGFSGYQWLQNHRMETADRAELAEVVNKLNAAVVSGAYADGYELFDATFRSRVSREAFVERFAALQSSPVYGRITKIDWNGIVLFEVAQGSGIRMAFTKLLITIEFGGQSGIDRQSIQFSRTPNGWRIRDIPVFFPTETRTVEGRQLGGGA
jgi:hypothetical protein